MQTLIIPGWYGSGPAHWQSWWLSSDPKSSLVAQDDWHHPSLDNWVVTSARAIIAAPDSVVVAHSLGCALVAHLAARLPQLPIAGALLVSPADVDDPSWTSPELAAFAPMPRQRLPFPAIVVASQNDPYVTFGRATELANAWGAELIDAGQSGHINADSGFGPWPEGQRLARRLLDRAASEDHLTGAASRPEWPFASPPLTRGRNATARYTDWLG